MRTGVRVHAQVAHTQRYVCVGTVCIGVGCIAAVIVVFARASA